MDDLPRTDRIPVSNSSTGEQLAAGPCEWLDRGERGKEGAGRRRARGKGGRGDDEPQPPSPQTVIEILFSSPIPAIGGAGGSESRAS